MENILKFLTWDSLHLDGVIVLLVICSGLWQKKYLETVNIIPAWKTLLVSLVGCLFYLGLLLISGELKNEKLVDYFISFAVATSMYDLIMKPIMAKFFPPKSKTDE